MTTARRTAVVVSALVALYVASYVGFRRSHIETWKRDGHDYVIIPMGHRTLYYLFRPIMYVDGAATGMRFHVGPHR